MLLSRSDINPYESMIKKHVAVVPGWNFLNAARKDIDTVFCVSV